MILESRVPGASRPVMDPETALPVLGVRQRAATGAALTLGARGAWPV